MSKITRNEIDNNKEVFHLVQDDDGHWYVINIKDDKKFNLWVYATQDDLEIDCDFEDCRLSGNPSRIHFQDYWEE